MLVNAKELKAKFEELDEKTAASKRAYESLIAADKLDEAKIKYIVYKGIKTARDTIETAWQNTEKQCVQVRDTLKNIEFAVYCGKDDTNYKVFKEILE